MCQSKEHSHYHNSHGHSNHNHEKDLKGKKLLLVTLLNLSITIVQVIGGILSNSLSLLSDALHNLGDSSAIFIAFLAGKRSSKQPDKRKTYGYKRVEIIAAFFNGIVLIVLCLSLFIEAYERFIDPKPIKGLVMLIVASFGLLANLISVLVLQKSKDKNLNIKAAYMHLMGDTLSSVAVIVGGIAIWLLNLDWIDPIITVLVGIYIIWHTYSVVKESIDILMQAVPANINIDEIKYKVEELTEIDNIHHIHVWKLDDHQINLEAHINLTNNVKMLDMMQTKEKVENLLHNVFGIGHITLQMGYNCCNGDNMLIVSKG